MLTFARVCAMCEAMEMARIRKPINLTLPPALIERLDRWCAAQDVPPKRAQAVERALEEFLEKRDAADDQSK